MVPTQTAAVENKEDKILLELGGSELLKMEAEELELFGVNNMMSKIEMQSLQDKVNDKLRQVQIDEKLSRLAAQ
mgnify:CR=1 FL=1